MEPIRRYLRAAAPGWEAASTHSVQIAMPYGRFRRSVIYGRFGQSVIDRRFGLFELDRDSQSAPPCPLPAEPPSGLYDASAGSQRRGLSAAMLA